MKKLFTRSASAVLLAISLTGMAFLYGCASTPAPISSSVVPVVSNPTIVTDLQSAAFNLDSAVTVGALSASDPAPKCLHGVLQQAGIEAVPGVAASKSFQPKLDGAASAGAIAYIKIQQAKLAINTGITVPVDCKTLLGQFVIDGLGATAKVLPVLPGLSLLPPVKLQ